MESCTKRSPNATFPGPVRANAPAQSVLASCVQPYPSTRSRHVDGSSSAETVATSIEHRAPTITNTVKTPFIRTRIFSVRVRPLTHPTRHPTTQDQIAQPSSPYKRALRDAFQVLSVVLRNSLGCLVCAWIANLCYNLGDVFSLRPSKDQSTKSLIVASLMWTNVLYCIIILLTQTAILAPLRFISHPDAPAGVLFAMKKLIKATSHYYFASVSLITSVGLLIANFMPSSLRWLKLEFYVGAFVNHLYTTGVEHATRRIYREETCKGQEQGRQRRENDTGHPPAPRRRRSGRSMQSYWRSYLKSTPKVLITLLAGTYVQAASQTRFMENGVEIMAFTIVSLILKVLIQELAKIYVLKSNIQQIRFMCVLLGLPTVLIDTQVRIVMLIGGQSSNLAAVGSVAMVFCEISMRVCKVWLIKYQIRRRERVIQRAANTVVSRNSNRSASARRKRTTSLTEFKCWKKQMLAFHTAETMADMYAEYIAIGCSASILFFFANHPKYRYGATSAASSSSTSSPSSSTSASGSSDTGGDASSNMSSLTYSHFKLIGFQLALEIVVDYVSCAFEIASGAPFESVHKFSSFLGFMFMTIAVVNINISSFLYLK